MTPNGILRVAVLAGIALSLAGRAAQAATIEITVVERGAGPVANQPVALYPVTPDNQSDPRMFLIMRPRGQCVTDAIGRCVIEGVAPGVYVPNLLPIVDPNLSAPIGSPFDAYGTVTVLKPDDKAALRIELQRGVRIQFRVISPKSALPFRTRVDLTSDSGEKAQAPVTPAGDAVITLGSGRWVAQLVGPPGARVVKVELDGGELDTLDVPIELVAPGSDRFVTWTLSAPCTIEGWITTDRKPPVSGVSVVATLLAPGAWGGSALCRAADCAGSPSGSPRQDGHYSFESPSGTWRVAPAGDSLLGSDPPFVDLTCFGGDDVRADFSVRETEPDTGPKAILVVHVENTDGRPISGVPVEVWPQGGNLEAAVPIATESTGRFSQAAVFTSLPAGSYLLRAKAAGYRTGVLPLPDLDPEGQAARSVRIRLDRGATIDALAKDEKDHPVAGVGLDVKRTDAPPPGDDPVARLAEQDAEISVPPSKDQTGHVLVSGLSAGAYDVRPTLSGALAATATATVLAGDGPGRKTVSIQLGERELKEIGVRVLPAASLSGRLVCADGGLFPRDADACVLRPPPADEEEATRDACKDPAIPSRTIALSGDRRDVFRVGPLEPGSYRLGLRPRGYAAWTWALGTPEGDQAALVQVEGTGAVDLATIKMLCGPAIELRPSVASHDPLPDLTVSKVEGELTRKGADGKVERRRLQPERDRDRVFFRELPEGEWTLEATLSHPYFVPTAPLHLSIPVKLERGVLIRESAEIESVGGAVQIDVSTGTARLSHGGEEARLEPVFGGKIAIGGVVPDAYLVELCEDAQCRRVLTRWDAVHVVRGATVELSPVPAR